MDIELFEDVQIVQSEDLKPFNQFYNPDLKKNQNQFSKNDNNQNLAILIDYGSYSTKAGWANSKVPDMIFRTVVSKNKDLKNIYHNVQVGNQLKEIDFLKMNYRSPFEKNIVQHFGLLENVNDYIFSNLGIQKERVDHPIVLTECFSNPEYCRLNVVEQFFECYDVPNLTLGVDTLFNYYNQQNHSDYCLQVSIGHTMIHVVPMIAGQVQRSEIKRFYKQRLIFFKIFYQQISIFLKDQFRNNHLFIK